MIRDRAERGETNILHGIALLAAWLTPTAASAERARARKARDPRVTAGFRISDEGVVARARGRAGPEAVLALKDEYRVGALPVANARGGVELPEARPAGPAAGTVPKLNDSEGSSPARQAPG